MPRKCIVCTRNRASYGVSYTRTRLRCAACRLPKDVNVCFVCKVCGAHKRMMYSDTEDGMPMRCVRCKKASDSLIYRRFCQGKHHPPGKIFRTVVTSKTDYLCHYCRHFGQWRCRKEREVIAYLSEHVKGYCPSTLNKAIHGNLSLKYRPDIYYDLGDRALVVEVDENQHESYPAVCEAKRMLEIAMTVNMPVIFLRYNPDRFQNTDGIPRRVNKLRRQRDLVDRVLYWTGRPRDEWPRFFRAEYLCYSTDREVECQEALDAALSDVYRIHPKLAP